MNNLKRLTIGVCLLIFSMGINGQAANTGDNDAKSQLQIIHTEELSTLVSEWTNAYSAVDQSLTFDLKSTKTLTSDMLQSGAVQLAFIADEKVSELNDENWKVLVGRDVVVAVVNSKNPYIDQIRKKGISPDVLANMLQSGKLTWNKVFVDAGYEKVQLAIADNKNIQMALQDFLSVDAEKVFKNSVPVDIVMNKVTSNPGAIGFINLNSAINMETNTLKSGVEILSIDKNNNGSIDYMEDIYSNLNDFNRGVWIGKYPRSLCAGIYMIAPEKQLTEIQVAFMDWVLTQGQPLLADNGFSNLTTQELKSALAMIHPATITNEVYAETKAKGFPWAMAGIVLLVVGVLTVNFIAGTNKKRVKSVRLSNIKKNALRAENISIPKGVYYDKSHTWVFREKGGEVRIGLDDFFQHVTGPLTSVVVKPVGEKVRKGEHLMTIVREGKKLDVYSPISGTILKYNNAIEQSPSLINTSPYDQGWVYIIQPQNWVRDIEFLRYAEKYQEWIKDEVARLKDFFAGVANSTALQGVPAYQDGGELQDGVLAEMSPEIWEEFQSKFIEESK